MKIKTDEGNPRVGKKRFEGKKGKRKKSGV